MSQENVNEEVPVPRPAKRLTKAEVKRLSTVEGEDFLNKVRDFSAKLLEITEDRVLGRGETGTFKTLNSIIEMENALIKSLGEAAVERIRQNRAEIARNRAILGEKSEQKKTGLSSLFEL